MRMFVPCSEVVGRQVKRAEVGRAEAQRPCVVPGAKKFATDRGDRVAVDAIDLASTRRAA